MDSSKRSVVVRLLNTLKLIVAAQGAYNGLNGVHGLAGWKCESTSTRLLNARIAHSGLDAGLFIIDGIITVPIALLGYLIMPGARP